MGKSKLVFDIETVPRKRDTILDDLLSYKMRNVKDEEQRKKDEIKYTFRNPIYNQVIAIGVLHEDINGNVKEGIFFSRDNEKELIEKFMHYISKFQGLFIHYNGLDFDVPILLAKAAIYGIEPSRRFCNTIRFRFDPHYDIMQALTNWNKFSISLREAATVFGVKDSKEILKEKDIDIIEFMKTATDEEIQKYCAEDVRTTYELFKKVYQIYQ